MVATVSGKKVPFQVSIILEEDIVLINAHYLKYVASVQSIYLSLCTLFIPHTQD